MNKLKKQIDEEEMPGGAYDETNDPQYEGAPHMAGGGFVPSDDELLKNLTLGTSQQIAPAPPPVQKPKIIQQDGNTYEFSPGNEGSLVARGALPEGRSPAAPLPMAKAKTVPLPGMPPDVTPDDIASYLSKNRERINRFGPEDEMALRDSINARRGSMGYKATEGLKGFADAVMMGVAGAGNPGWQNQFQQKENQIASDQRDALRSARASNLQQTEASMSLDRMDPNSSISKAAQDSFGPLFKKLGYPEQSMSGMSAANIESALNLMTQYGGKEIEALLRGQEMALAVQQFQEAQRHNQQLEELQSVDDRMKAAQETLDRGRFLGIPVPYMAAPYKDRLAAERYLSQVTEGDSASGIEGAGATKTPPNPEITKDVMDAAEKWGISPDQALRIKKQRGG